MEVKGITADQVRWAVEMVNARYDGQLELKPGNYPNYEQIRELNRARNRVSFTLKVKDVRNKPGARRGHERRINAACWHLNRDLYVELFKINPDAKITTALSTYDGWEDFLAKYPATGDKNIGSNFQPLYMAQACNCHEFETYDADTILYRDLHERVLSKKAGRMHETVEVGNGPFGVWGGR